MNDYGEEKQFWRASRIKRGLSISKLAKMLAEKYQIGVTVAQLSNWEYRSEGKTNMDLWRVMEEQMREWRREDFRAAEEKASYGFEFSCPACKVMVPGPGLGGRYCMHCGHHFECRICRECGFAEQREAVRFCAGCGVGFEK
jgi:hypothetical protein